MLPVLLCTVISPIKKKKIVLCIKDNQERIWAYKLWSTGAHFKETDNVLEGIVISKHSVNQGERDRDSTK